MPTQAANRLSADPCRLILKELKRISTVWLPSTQRQDQNRDRFTANRLIHSSVGDDQPLSDDLINIRGEAEADMSGLNLNMLDVRSIAVDTSLPCNKTVEARINRHHRCQQRHLLAPLDLGGNGVEIDAEFEISLGGGGVFGAADNRCAQSDHLAHQVGPFTRYFARQIAAKAPTDEPDW